MYGTGQGQNTILREDFVALWPQDEWPKLGLTFISATKEGSQLWGNWLDGTGVGYATHQECRVIKEWLSYSEKYYSKSCQHEYVNVSFNLLTMACKKCGASQ